MNCFLILIVLSIINFSNGLDIDTILKEKLGESFSDADKIKELSTISTEPKKSKVKKRPGVDLPLYKYTTTEIIPTTYHDDILTNETKLLNDSEFIKEKDLDSSSVSRKGVSFKEVSASVPRKGVGNPPPELQPSNNSTTLIDNESSDESKEEEELGDDSKTPNKTNIQDSKKKNNADKSSETDSVDADNKNLDDSSDIEGEEDSSEENSSSEDLDVHNEETHSGNETKVINKVVPDQPETLNDTQANNVSLLTSTLPPLLITKLNPADITVVSTTSSMFENASSITGSGAVTVQKPSTASDEDGFSKSSSNTAIIVAILIVISVCGLIGFIAYKRLHAYWYRRHYSRVDFLIDGLYEI